MKIFRRIMITTLLMVLCFVMMLSSASAHNFTDVTRYDDAIGLLSTLEVIKGYSATSFGPEDPVTRWQMALLISKLITGNVDTSTWEAADNSSSFTDVKFNHYFGSIAYANRNGIVIGRNSETFAPEDPITLQDGLTMVVRALGYPSADLNSGYPDSYIQKGRDLGLLADINNIGYEANMTRGHTAQLLYNALYAEMYNGQKIVDSVFGIVERTIVLTATENMKINTNVSYAKSDTLNFSQMDDYGRLTDAFTLPASLFDLKSPNEYLGYAYKIVSTKDFNVILELTPMSKLVLESKTEGLTAAAGSKTVTIGNGVYEPVAGYRTYKLTTGVVPTGTKEIIIYGMNNVFSTQGTIVMTNEIVGTTAYYKMIAFDDNDDGFIDRALYSPYSFGRYIVDSSNKVSIAGNESTSAILFTGVTARHEDYVIYSYNPQSKTLDILKVLEVKEDKVGTTEYTAAQGTIKIGETVFNIGRTDANGVTAKSELEKPLLNVVTGTLQNRKIKYLADGANIYWYELGEAETNKPTSYGLNIGVVTSIPQYNASYGYYSVVLATPTANSASLNVIMVDGATVASNVIPLNKGEMVQYEVSSTLTGGVVVYKVTKINNAPTYNTLTANSKFNVTNSFFNIEENKTVTKNYPLSSVTPIYYLDASMNFTTYILSSFTEKEVQTYYSVFLAFDSTNSISAVYLRPFDSSSVANTGDYNKIVYISNNDINASASNLPGYRIYNAYDLMTGNYMNVTLSHYTVPGVTALTGAGYYRVFNDVITSVYPITESVLSSTSLVMARSVVIPSVQKLSESYFYRINNTQFSTHSANIKFYVQSGSTLDGYVLTPYATDSAQFLNYINNISTSSVDIIYYRNQDYIEGTYYGSVVIIAK